MGWLCDFSDAWISGAQGQLVARFNIAVFLLKSVAMAQVLQGLRGASSAGKRLPQDQFSRATQHFPAGAEPLIYR